MVAFKDGVAIVTGGAGIMGRAVSKSFAAEGAKVLIASRNEADGAEVVASIRDKGGVATFVKTDVTREADVKAMVDAALREFGRLDFAVNLAGHGHEPTRLADMTLDAYEESMALNARGTFLSLKYEIPAMLRNGGGAIVNISSGAGSGGFAMQSVYSAGKHAVNGLTRSAALEYAPQNIRINAVSPGVTNTPRVGKATNREKMMAAIPARRFGEVQEIADAALYLCSDRASYVYGQILQVCGGYNRVCASGTLPPRE